MAKIKQDAKYAAIHLWIRKYKPKPKYCEICKSNPPQQIASIDGKCRRDVNNYMWLCRSCHCKYDRVGEKGLGKYIKGLKGEKSPRWKGGKKEYQCTKCDTIIYRHRSTVRNENRVFCSRGCKNRYFIGKNLGKKNPNYKHGRYCK